MAWPIPDAKTLAARFAGRIEALILKLKPDADPVKLSAAVRGSMGVIAALGRTFSLEIREAHDHISYWARQYFVDTAEDENVTRHGNMWGVDARPATKARGTIELTGASGTIIPKGSLFAGAGAQQIASDSLIVIDIDGTVTVTATAVAAGIAGNLDPNLKLAAVIHIAGLTNIVVDDEGFAGGSDVETSEQHRAAVQDHIRERPHGGAGFDYKKWLRTEFDIHAVKVLPDWIGRGSVGLAVLMRDGLYGRAPNDAELLAMLTFLGAPASETGVRPVTAHIVTLAAVETALDLTVRLRPDTPKTRAAVTEAWHTFLATLGDDLDIENTSPIGALIEYSRLSEAISSASGEYAHDLILPAASVQLDPIAFAIPNEPTFAAAL